MIKKLITIISSVLFVNNIFAHSTYVICSTNERDWEWLKADNKYVSVSGEWKYVWINSTSFSYFKITDSVKVEDLQNKCINQFGTSYVYAQPSDNRFSKWNVFGTDDKNLSSGFYTYCHSPWYQKFTTCYTTERFNKKNM